jgi:hypothetical protein
VSRSWVPTLTRLGGAVVLVCAAILTALLARDVVAWRGETARASIAIHRSSTRPAGEPHTLLPVVLSRAILGAGDDVTLTRLLQGVQRLKTESGPAGRFDPSLLELARLELAFDEIANRPGPVTIRSRAHQLHAILLFQQLVLQSAGGTASAATALERTISELRQAARLDPENAEAQYDLETVLLIYRPVATQLAGERAYQKTKRGNTGAAGGAGGAIGELGRF